jgi:hypothetical protein
MDYKRRNRDKTLSFGNAALRKLQFLAIPVGLEAHSLLFAITGA